MELLSGLMGSFRGACTLKDPVLRNPTCPASYPESLKFYVSELIQNRFRKRGSDYRQSHESHVKPLTQSNPAMFLGRLHARPRTAVEPCDKVRASSLQGIQRLQGLQGYRAYGVYRLCRVHRAYWAYRTSQSVLRLTRPISLQGSEFKDESVRGVRL